MIYWTSLIVHIIAGMIALLSGGMAILSRKGGPMHRLTGRIFAVSILSTACSAIILSLVKPNLFLLAIGIFTLYMGASGWLWVLRIPHKLKIRLNYVIGSFGFLCALFLLLLSIMITSFLQIILWVFGGILLFMVFSDFKKKPKPSQNVIRHISKMGGAYIATVTAFLVVNVSIQPSIMVWIVPSIIGSVLITRAIRMRNTMMR